MRSSGAEALSVLLRQQDSELMELNVNHNSIGIQGIGYISEGFDSIALLTMY
jgi:hypothetical protein